ncbi:MAG: hypothetical protein V2J51_08500 [Erythrobacter sp.]|jgi:hypothetical protein|nr:hypothetical protein [Erythrobacter sp.]
MTKDQQSMEAEAPIEIPSEGPLFDANNPSGFSRMTPQRFLALALWGLPTRMREETVPVSYWSADNERLLALVFQNSETSKSGISIIGRDEEGRYRPFAFQNIFPTVRAAEDAICGNFGRSALELEAKFDELTDQPPGTDLFAAIPGVDKLHPAFRYLRDGVNQRAARELLSELSQWIPDLDGNLARDLQTTGYSARIWELYLSVAFREMNFAVLNEQAVPDFHLVKGDQTIFVEATTANAPDPMAVAVGLGPPPGPPDDFWSFIEKEMPLKFGSPLHSKMQKRYWEKTHVEGHPLVLAIADFHDRASMTWSHTGLPIYLHGRSAHLEHDEQGAAIGKEIRIPAFRKGNTEITPFFEQPDTENISAILFSNAGTISKFNRMGVRAGFGDRFVRVRRIGGWNDPHPDAFEPISFDLDVESSLYEEAWADELEMYHNPKALQPIDDELFPGIAHFRIEGGEAIWRGPSPRVLFSQTLTMDLLGREHPEDFATMGKELDTPSN